MTDPGPDKRSSCALCGTHTALGRYRVCVRCTETFLDHLDEVIERYPQLDANPGKGGDDSGRGAPGFRSTAPGSVHVMTMRDRRSKDHAVADDAECEEKNPPLAVHGELREICGRIVSEREFSRTDNLATVEQCCRFLGGQADWIARSDNGSVFMERVSRLRGQLRRATGVKPPRPIGKCIEYVDEEHMCLAPIYMPETEPRGDDESVRDMPPVQCRKCGSLYDGRRLIILRLSWEQAA